MHKGKHVSQWFSAWGDFTLWGAFGSVWRHFGLSWLGRDGGCYWHQVGRGQGCRWTPAVYRPAPLQQRRNHLPKTLIVLRLWNLCESGRGRVWEMQLSQGVRKNFGKVSPEPGNKWPYTPDRRVLIFFFPLTVSHWWILDLVSMIRWAV